jgi:hypothetical protein
VYVHSRAGLSWKDMVEAVGVTKTGEDRVWVCGLGECVASICDTVRSYSVRRPGCMWTVEK